MHFFLEAMTLILVISSIVLTLTTTLLVMPWKLSRRIGTSLLPIPPCTALCVTGNRHYSGSPVRAEAVEFFREFLDCAPKVCVENPVGVISSVIRPPDQYIQPWMFGHRVTKKTGLWLKGLLPLEPTNIVDTEEQVTFSSGKTMSRWFYETSLLPQKERAHARSITFQGIADAMAEQWG